MKDITKEIRHSHNYHVPFGEGEKVSERVVDFCKQLYLQDCSEASELVATGERAQTGAGFTVEGLVSTTQWDDYPGQALEARPDL